MTDLPNYTELADLLDALPLIVREARRARRLTLAQVAERTGMSASTLSRLERPMIRTRQDGDATAVSLSSAVTLLRWLDQGSDSAESDPA